jgi:hypothetical protein
MSDAGIAVDERVIEISQRLEELPNANILRTNDDFMRAGVATTSDLVELAKISACLVRPSGVGYAKCAFRTIVNTRFAPR